MHKSLYKNSGFTFIELMIVIGMISILSAIAVPSLMKWMPNYRLKAEARNLYSNMQKARMEAVKRNANVIITFAPVTYNPAGQVGSYLVSIDSNGNKSYDTGETIMFQKNMPKNVSLISTTFGGVSGIAVKTAGYTSRGISLEITTKEVQFQNNNSRYYRLTLSPAGNVRMHISSDQINWN